MHNESGGRAREGRGPDRRSLAVAACFAAFAVLLGLYMRGAGAERIVAATGDLVTLEVFRPYAASRVAAFMLLSILGAVLVALASLRPFSPRVFMVVALCLLIVDLLPEGEIVTVDGHLGIVTVGPPEFDLELR